MELFFNYLRYEKHYSAHTLLAYQNDLAQFAAHLKAQFGHEDLNQADHTLIRSWMVALIRLTSRRVITVYKISSSPSWSPFFP